MRVTVHPADRRVADQLDIGGLFDSLRQVAGHFFVQVISPEQKQYAAGVPGEKDRRLTGGIPATDNYDVASRAKLGLGVYYAAAALKWRLGLVGPTDSRRRATQAAVLVLLTAVAILAAVRFRRAELQPP